MVRDLVAAQHLSAEKSAVEMACVPETNWMRTMAASAPMTSAMICRDQEGNACRAQPKAVSLKLATTML